MKRAVSLAILIICLFAIYQFSVTYFKKTHEITYTVKKEPYVFQIQEYFKNNQYYFQIQVNDVTFYMDEKNYFNKAKQVIENIEILESNEGMICIYPILKDHTPTTITCKDKNMQYAYESIKYKEEGIRFLNQLREKKIKPIFDDEYQETEEKVGKIYYYPKAFENELISLWTYRGFSLFDNERALSESTLSFDRYENTLSLFVGKYYVTPLYIDNRLYEFNSVQVFDTKTHTDFTISLDTTVSNYTYVNGIVDEKLYLFDKNNRQQIEINPKTKSAKVIASGNEDAIFYQNGDWSVRNIYDFIQSEIKFINFDDTPLKQQYTYTVAFATEDSFYFYDGIGFYQVYKDALDTKILLFEQEKIENIKVVNGYVYYTKNGTLYKYTPKKERRRIIRYGEFLYNSLNLYDVYLK